MASGRGLSESPAKISLVPITSTHSRLHVGGCLIEPTAKISLGEPKKSPHKDPFCQNKALRGLSGVLVLGRQASKVTVNVTVNV